MQRSTSPPPLARRVFPDRAAGLLPSPGDGVCAGSRFDVLPWSSHGFHRTAQRASRSRGPAPPGLAVLIRAKPVERLETLRSTSATQLWFSKVAHGVRPRAGSHRSVTTELPEELPLSRSTRPRFRFAVHTLAGWPEAPWPPAVPSVAMLSMPHTFVVRSASSDLRLFLEERKAGSRSAGRRATHGPRRQGPPEPERSASFRRRMPPSRLLSSSRASRDGMAPEGNAAIETSPATRYRAPCFG